MAFDMWFDRWESYDREAREKAHTAYIAQEHYPALVQEAALRGFRPATIDEIHMGAKRLGLDQYRWMGGIWIKEQ